ncbi:MAG: hypothetical protein U0Q18_27065 [Bryobacteraceae bacterium]
MKKIILAAVLSSGLVLNTAMPMYAVTHRHHRRHRRNYARHRRHLRTAKRIGVGAAGGAAIGALAGGGVGAGIGAIAGAGAGALYDSHEQHHGH